MAEILSSTSAAELVDIARQLKPGSTPIENGEQETRLPTEPVTEDELKAVAKQIYEIEGGKAFPVTDLRCGELLGRIFIGSNRYNTTWRAWSWYNGKKWVPDAEEMHIERSAAIFANALVYYSLLFMHEDVSSSELNRFRQDCTSLSRRTKRKAVIQDARRIGAYSAEELDADNTLFGVYNGVLNWETGEFTEHRPEYMLSKIAGCNYDPEAKRQDWSVFVSQIMKGDEEKIRFLQTFVGYILTGRPVHECFLILYGASTRNGKGTFCETLLRMFGDYGASIRPESLAVKRNKDGSAASDDIARLAGVRYLNCSEPAKGLHIDEALVKSLTGGDRITARHLYERFFEFTPAFSLVMNVNYLPLVVDPTLFTSGRVMVLPFDRHFTEEEQDKGLKARLQEPENLSAVLNWALEGLRIYKSEGLTRPACVLSATAEYQDDSDKITRFFSEELEERPDSTEPASAVYDRFVSWCKRSGLYAESKQNFFQLLRGRGLLQKSGTVRGYTVRNVVTGYRLLEWDDLPEEWS